MLCSCGGCKSFGRRSEADSSTPILRDDDGLSFFHPAPEPRKDGLTTVSSKGTSARRRRLFIGPLNCFRTAEPTTTIPHISSCSDSPSTLLTDDTGGPFNSRLQAMDSSYATEAPPHCRFDTIIQPIMQDGVKMSDTHYWMFKVPRQKPASVTPAQSMFTDAFKDSHINSSAEPENHSQTDSWYADKNFEDVRILDNANNSESAFITLQRREALVSHLKDRVPDATLEDCEAVLIGSSWRFEQAEQRLKLEMLNRFMPYTLSYLGTVLATFDWNLDLAQKHLELARLPRRRHRRRNKSSQTTREPLANATLDTET